MDKDALVFVDPFSSNSFLAENLKTSGISNAVVYSIQNVDNGFMHSVPELFDKAYFIESHNKAQILDKLKSLPTRAVFSSCEGTVDISDEIANCVAPEFANPLASSAWRSDKYAMQERIHSKGLRSIKQMRIENKPTREQMQTIEAWPFPLIIKPTNSAASHGVEICHNMQALIDYFAMPLLHNFLGQKISAFIIQEYIVGTEYLVDSFSVNGVHHISTIQRYKKDIYAGNPIYQHVDVVLTEDPIYTIIVEYIQEVLTALELNNGLAHSELIVTETGPCLIEVNPRISGAYGLMNKLARYSNGLTQIDFLKYFYEQTFLPVSNSNVPSRGVFLQNYQTREIRALNLELLQTLASFKEAKIIREPGTLITPPRNLLDMVGWIIFAHPNEKQIDQDHLQLLIWLQQERLF